MKRRDADFPFQNQTEPKLSEMEKHTESQAELFQLCVSRVCPCYLSLWRRVWFCFQYVCWKELKEWFI